MTKNTVLILDFGSPYTRLIAQRIRENHVFCRIVPYNISAKEIKLQKPKGLILSGRSARAYNKKPPLPEKAIFKLKIPILGIDYGMQAIVKILGGRVKSAKIPEFQRCELFIDSSGTLFWQIPSNITSWMNSSDCIKKLPAGFKKTAHTQTNPIAAISCQGKKIFGVGFHPEVVSTQRGSQILSNFLYKICGCIGSWTMDAFIRETIAGIKKTVGKSKVVMNITPTLNSFVTAILINKAIGKRLKCIFIDNGLLRKDEKKQIKKAFEHHSSLNLSYIDRSKRFFQVLKGLTHPEEKRNAARSQFLKIFQEEVKRVRGTEFLAQAMLYPDVGKPPSRQPGIEDVFKESRIRLKPLQPLRDLFKDEVKVVAKEMNLPDNIIFRQPFPDTGLVSRIIGEVSPQRLKILREAQNCLVEEIKTAGIYEQ
ncbi:glutamine-hydrolyzing GMP synthase, partial [Candidatus Omnitrophota bacterium]